MNYIQDVKAKLRMYIRVEPELLELYSLLVLTTGEKTSWQDVHDAWSVWKSRKDPIHRSVIPYELLSPEVRLMDKEYADAIRRVAEEMEEEKEGKEKEVTAHDFEDIYKKEGIEVNKLGCVMLDTEPITKPVMYDLEIPEVFYHARNPDHFWIKGYVADNNPHVTLLYGLLTPAYEQEENINEVMEGWEMPSITIKEFGFFPSHVDDEEYYCIVGHVEVTDKLLEAHQRLSFLPHVNTFTEFKPHLTIAYVVKDEAIRDRIINDMNKLYAGKELKAVPELNLGSEK